MLTLRDRYQLLSRPTEGQVVYFHSNRKTGEHTYDGCLAIVDLVYDGGRDCWVREANNPAVYWLCKVDELYAATEVEQLMASLAQIC